jgi:hypothetical protein
MKNREIIDLEYIETYLAELGCTDIEVSEEETIFECPDGIICRIDTGDIDTEKTLPFILKMGDKGTCCGDWIAYDGDSDICPTCKEHC